MHSAVLLAASADAAGLADLGTVARTSEDPVFREVVAPLCSGLGALVEQRWDTAATVLSGVVATMDPLGGSKAQREVVEDTLVHALAMAGRNQEAADVLDARLSRRALAADARRRARLVRVDPVEA